MRKIILSFFIYSFYLLYANELNNKVVMYIIKRDGCPACIYQQKIIKLPDINNIIKSSFKIVYIDFYNQDKLPYLWMHTKSTPTVHFLDKKGNKLIDSINSVNKNTFKAKLLEAKRHLNN